ncbi:MAG TPA: DUF998 domain-containing protein [Candidatus Corynebacterium gallistercoris]|uniref:DUF998 domain-containing protein n=1 Tax=Candidatus Corynebacterium gallistercoris TaxID=2838530 RepID=A0A9D1UQ17_9CORY|nr:DUF998 domain-containing protein [Candidatus Corynebacterium gallistercoris]
MSLLPSAKARLAGRLLMACGVLYATLVLEALLGWPIPVDVSYLSEMSAQTMTHGRLFRFLDATAGTCALLAAAVLWRHVLPALPLHSNLQPPQPSAQLSLRQRAFFTRASTLLLGVFGVATILDALFPLDCAVFEPKCLALERSGAVSLEHKVHVFTSSVATGATLVLCCLVIAWWWRTRLRDFPTLALAVFSLVAVVSNLWFLVAYVGFGEVAGVAQRANILAVCVVLLLAGWRLLRYEAAKQPCPYRAR